MTQFADYAARLFTVLAEEEKLYLELKALLQAEREHIASRNTDEIEQTVMAKEGLAREGKLLEECRQRVMREVAVSIGLPESDATLSRISAALGEEGGELRAIHSRLVALIAAVRELLTANSTFAGEALNRVQSTLRLLGRLLPDEPTYGRSPSRQVAQPHMKPGRIVRQSA
ncbi:MAG: flagellar biosynthesis/type III secretory pathway chaperone [Myxococcota bacterium]|jgi:flagellar biosynthesis/type III secretory pathway chaperone